MAGYGTAKNTTDGTQRAGHLAPTVNALGSAVDDLDTRVTSARVVADRADGVAEAAKDKNTSQDATLKNHADEIAELQKLVRVPDASSTTTTGNRIRLFTPATQTPGEVISSPKPGDTAVANGGDRGVHVYQGAAGWKLVGHLSAEAGAGGGGGTTSGTPGHKLTPPGDPTGTPLAQRAKLNISGAAPVVVTAADSETNDVTSFVISLEAGAGGGAAEDTGWVFLTPETGYAAEQIATYGPISVRRIGNRVQLRGMLQNTDSSFNKPGLILPEGFRPPFQVITTVPVYSPNSGSIPTVHVHTDGQVRFAAGTASWVLSPISFLTD